MRELEAAREAEERAIREREEQLAHQRKMEQLHERELEMQLEFERLEKQRKEQEQRLQQQQEQLKRQQEDLLKQQQQLQQQSKPYNGPSSKQIAASAYERDRDGRVGGYAAPPPPERTSSYDVYSKTTGSGYEPSQYGSQPPRSVRLPEPSQKKSVSFDSNLTTEIHEARRFNSTTSTSSESSYNYQRQESGEVTSPDADTFQRSYRSQGPPSGPPPPVPTSNNHLATPSHTSDGGYDPMRTPENTYDPRHMVGSTPGVVGAQEVYRDPRDRIAAQRGDPHAGKIPGPERLSFGDKMKMFAHEIGDATPEDRQKISSAQRRLETELNGQR